MVILIFLYFLLGIIFCKWIIPLVDGIINVILTALEVIKSKLSVKISTYTNQIQRISNLQSEETINNVIGFTLPDSDNEEDIKNE